MSATDLLGETKTPDDQLETATARDTREDSVVSAEGDATSATKELGETKTPDEQLETAPARDTRKKSSESTEGDTMSATKLLGETKSLDEQLETAEARYTKENPLESTDNETASATQELGETKSPAEKAETALARDTREDSFESTEDETKSVTKEVGEIKTPGKKVETAQARDTREDSSQSMEGYATIATKELAETKTPDEQLDTTPARDTREDSLEITEGDTTSSTKEFGETKNPDEQVDTAPARDTREHSVESTEGDTTSGTKELGETKSPDEKVEIAPAPEFERTEGELNDAGKPHAVEAELKPFAGETKEADVIETIVSELKSTDSSMLAAKVTEPEGIAAPEEIDEENEFDEPDLKIDVHIDSSGEAQVATASDAAEVLALTSTGSFDATDDCIKHMDQEETLIDQETKHVEPMQEAAPPTEEPPVATVTVIEATPQDTRENKPEAKNEEKTDTVATESQQDDAAEVILSRPATRGGKSGDAFVAARLSLGDKKVLTAAQKAKIKKKTEDDLNANRVQTRRSARNAKVPPTKESKKRKSLPPHADEVPPPKTSRKRKSLTPQQEKVPPSKESRKRKLPPAEPVIQAGWSTLWKTEASQVPSGPQWEELDHKMIVSDYVYGGNESLPFGDSTLSALEAVEKELAKVGAVETPESVEEEQLYNRSIRNRGRLMNAEKAVREKEKLQFDDLLKEYKKQQRQLKKAPEQLEYEAFVEKNVQYVLSNESCSDEFECNCGGDWCRLCTPPHTDEVPAAAAATIDAPSVRPSTVTDPWRENTVEEEPELTGFGGKKGKTAPAPKRRRTSRRSHRTSNRIGLMLLEMKHSLEFLHEYNRGYLP